LLSVTFGLNYWQNWWDELAGVVLIYYVSINGYAQTQPGHRLTFSDDLPVSTLPMTESIPVFDPIPEADSLAAAIPAIVPRSAGLVSDLVVLKTNLLAYMEIEKPYLDPDLSLSDLARRMHTNPVVLSQVINTGVGKNFNDFVNEYRVEEFKRQVREPANAHLSFLGLALDCGFNSKATFNRAFKKFTGASPKAFAET